MNVLILHAIDGSKGIRRAIFQRTTFFLRYYPKFNYYFQSYFDVVDPEVITRDYDFIFIDTTFLCYRWVRPSEIFDDLLDRYDFVRKSKAVKIAFPQDDYDHSEILDRWMCRWNVGAIYTPLKRFSRLLYPRAIKKGIIIEDCLTGYFDEEDKSLMAKWARPFHERPVDVGFRSTALPPQFGMLGHLKSTIGERFKRKAKNYDLTLDISNKPEDTFFGEDWLKFLGNCKFIIGTASGSSLWDPKGLVMDKVTYYLQTNPDANFYQVRDACFKELDSIYWMSALGPRHVEAAAAGVTQILLPDKGLFPLVENVHYIPTDQEIDNIDEIIFSMNLEKKSRMFGSAARTVLLGQSFTYADLAKRVLKTVEEISEKSFDGGVEERGPSTYEDIVLEFRSSITGKEYIYKYAQKKKINLVSQAKKIINRFRWD